LDENCQERSSNILVLSYYFFLHLNLQIFNGPNILLTLDLILHIIELRALLDEEWYIAVTVPTLPPSFDEVIH
jgi:hypothetical protein